MTRKTFRSTSDSENPIHETARLQAINYLQTLSVPAAIIMITIADPPTEKPGKTYRLG